MNFANASAHNAYMRFFFECARSLFDPAFIQLAIAIDKLHKGSVRRVLHDAGEALIPRPRRAEGLRCVELDGAAAHGARILRAAVCRT